jgi:DNA-binding NarL/FixJ family response regulator
MRIVLIGSPRERARLRAGLDGSIEVVAEFATMAAARAAGADAEAMLVANGDEDRERVAAEHLTAREIQVVELLAEGLSNKAIASRLGISDQTVKFHVASLSGKLGAANRTDAVRRAVRRGLIAL